MCILKVYLHTLESLGVDFFWNDYKGDKDVSKMWVWFITCIMTQIETPIKEVLFLSRGSIIAPQRYPVIYGGPTEITWEALAKETFTYINASNMGISWLSLDVGGNHGGIEESELYIRQVQLGCFSPILRFHAARGPYYKKNHGYGKLKQLILLLTILDFVIALFRICMQQRPTIILE